MHVLKMERRKMVSSILFIFMSESRQKSIRLRSRNQRLSNVMIFP